MTVANIMSTFEHVTRRHSDDYKVSERSVGADESFRVLCHGVLFLIQRSNSGAVSRVSAMIDGILVFSVSAFGLPEWHKYSTSLRQAVYGSVNILYEKQQAEKQEYKRKAAEEKRVAEERDRAFNEKWGVT